MSDVKFRIDPEESLSDLEAAALQSRLGPDYRNFDLRPEGAVTMRDVAEATGLSPDQVADHIRQIRAEAGFREPEVQRSSPLPWIAVGALVVAVGITWWRINPAAFDVALPTVSPAENNAPSVIRNLSTTNLPIDMTRGGPNHAPPGMRVEAIGQRTDLMDEAMGSERRAQPYDKVRDDLVASAQSLVENLSSSEGTQTATPGTRYHGMDGGIFSPRPGFVRLSMSGWAGSESAWIAVPLTPLGKGEIQDLANKVLESVKQEQDAALVIPTNIKEGIVLPPPGFAIQFAGRRFDDQKGPRISFSNIPTTVVVKRLEAALLNALYRDGRPPVGAWSGNAAQDAKIPQPDLSRVELTGPGGTITADIPTRLGDGAATKNAVHILAEKAAKQIEPINEKGLESDAPHRF